MSTQPSAASAPRRFYRTLLRFLSSIRLGIVLIALIIAFSSVGSAVPPFRQFFELTEFQYFNHWIFGALLGAFCLTLMVATVQRIPFNRRNLGVLTVHTGLLVLCAGSFVYFGHKIEGDVVLQAPAVQVLSLARLNAGQNPVLDSFVAVEGKTWDREMPMIGGKYHMEVLQVKHKDMIAAHSVQLSVTVGDASPKLVQFNQSEPHGDLAKVNDQIVLQLLPATLTDRFYDNQTPMIIVSNDQGTARYEIPELPFYLPHFLPGEADIVDTHDQVVSSARISGLPVFEHWHLPIPLNRPLRTSDLSPSIQMEVDGYLPYAALRSWARPGGAVEDPLARVTLTGNSETQSDWLISDIPSRSQLETAAGDAVEFRWLGDETTIDPQWTRNIRGKHVLDVWIRDKDIHRQFEVTAGQRIAIEGTDYKLTVEELRPSWPLMTSGFESAKTPIALVWVETPQRSFQRSILQRYPDLNQDRDRAGKKILDSGGLVDSNIYIRYTDAAADRFMIFAGRNLSPTVVHTAAGGQRSVHPLTIGSPFKPEAGQASLTLETLIDKPIYSEVPTVIPEQNRQPLNSVGRARSLVRIHLSDPKSGWQKRVWVPFNLHNSVPYDNPPTVVDDVPGVGSLQIVYGRAERPLPGWVTLERLQTDYYPGGQRPREWISYIRFQDEGHKEVVRANARLNHTAKIGPWTLFQATAANDGESFTGLGVGNRDGVLTQLAGCFLIALGMIYAFAVKPILVRRYKQRIAEDARDRKASGPESRGSEVDEILADDDDAEGALVGTGAEPAPTGSGNGRHINALLLLACAGSLLFATVGAGRDTSDAASVDQIPASIASLTNICDRLDLESLGALEMIYNARFSTVESWARDVVDTVHGPKSLYGLPPVAAAIELMFNAQAYADEPIIFIKDLGVRQNITADPVPVTDDEMHRIRRTGMVSYNYLRQPQVAAILEELSSDMRIRNAMNRVASARTEFESMGERFAVVPNSTKPDEAWHIVQELAGNLPADSGIPHDAKAPPIPGIPPELALRIVQQYRAFAAGWFDRDPERINGAIHELETSLSSVLPPGVYPDKSRRVLEVKYFRWDLAFWSWLCYVAAFFAGVFALATRFRWARGLTLVFLFAAIGLHAAAIALRWMVIGRIPVANMYEAVVFSAFVGAVFCTTLELITAKRVYALAAGFLGLFALALPLLHIIQNHIETMMPILDDVMLRIHTVLIVSSYAVITLAYVVANCYLVVSAFRDRTALAQGAIGAQVGVIAALVYAWTAHREFGPALVVALISFGALIGMTALPLALQEFRRRGPVARPTVDASAFPFARDILVEFDLAQRVLLYTAMVALFVGLVLGAVWADYSWGRPWGWDPKEVFALNTWLVYAILIHARFVTKRRALWTSVLSVVGFAAMQFNWWVVNFYIVGLHSYA